MEQQPNLDGSVAHQGGPWEYEDFLATLMMPPTQYFADHAGSVVDLGSCVFLLPADGEIQIELGLDGPQQIHVLTPYGRITPVAFAAAKTGGLWEEQAAALRAEMESQGFLVESTLLRDRYPALVAQHDAVAVVIIGYVGSHWLYRCSVVAPTVCIAEALESTLDFMACSVIRRGHGPRPHGQILPITLPPPLLEQLQAEMRRVQHQEPAPADQMQPVLDDQALDQVAASSQPVASQQPLASPNPPQLYAETQQAPQPGAPSVPIPPAEPALPTTYEQVAQLPRLSQHIAQIVGR